MLYSSFISIHQACVTYIHNPFLVLVDLLLKNNSVVDMFFRMTNPVNKAVFVRVVEAIHHDYGGKEQCPWTSAQLKGILYSVLQGIMTSLVILLCTLGMDVEKHNLD